MTSPDISFSSRLQSVHSAPFLQKAKITISEKVHSLYQGLKEVYTENEIPFYCSDLDFLCFNCSDQFKSKIKKGKIPVFNGLIFSPSYCYKHFPNEQKELFFKYLQKQENLAEVFYTDLRNHVILASRPTKNKFDKLTNLLEFYRPLMDEELYTEIQSHLKAFILDACSCFKKSEPFKCLPNKKIQNFLLAIDNLLFYEIEDETNSEKTLELQTEKDSQTSFDASPSLLQTVSTIALALLLGRHMTSNNMIKASGALCALSIPAMPVSAQAQATDYFYQTLNISSSSMLVDVFPTGENDFIGTGFIDLSGDGRDFALYRSVNNNLTWMTTFNQGAWEQGQTVRPAANETLIIAGETYSIGQGPINMLFVEGNMHDGSIKKEVTLGGSGADVLQDMKRTITGNIAFGGQTTTDTRGSQDAMFGILAPDLSKVLWTKYWGGTGSDSILRITLSQDGGIIGAGLTTSYGAGQQDCLVMKVNQTNGDLIWGTIFGGTKSDICNAVIALPDGGCDVLATSNSFSTGGDYDLFYARLSVTIHIPSVAF